MRPTIESVWFGLTGSPVEETLLEWAPDTFAFTGTMLERSQAYRFAVSPPAGRQWPPTRRAEWSDAISDAAAQSSISMSRSRGTMRTISNTPDAPYARASITW